VVWRVGGGVKSLLIFVFVFAFFDTQQWQK